MKALSQKGNSVEIEKNRFKRAIQNGEVQIGLWTGLANHMSMEILKDSGFEWILIDMEHYPNEIPLLAGQLQALEGGSATPIVRPPWNDPVWIKRILDQGVFSLLFPMIQTAEEAELAEERVEAAGQIPPLAQALQTAHSENVTVGGQTVKKQQTYEFVCSAVNNNIVRISGGALGFPIL